MLFSIGLIFSYFDRTRDYFIIQGKLMLLKDFNEFMIIDLSLRRKGIFLYFIVKFFDFFFKGKIFCF